MQDPTEQAQSLLITADRLLERRWHDNIADGNEEGTRNIEIARKHLKNCYERVLKDLPNNVGKRVRWWPTDTDENYDGTILEEKDNFFVVVPDNSHAPTQNWNKETCEILTK